MATSDQAARGFIVATPYETAGPAGTLVNVLERFRQRGTAPAIIALGDGPGLTVSFRELFEASYRIAEELASRGVERGATVGLMAPSGLAWIEAFWGILAAGGVAMPVDMQISDADLKRMIAVGECRFVLAGRGQGDRLTACVPSGGVLDLDGIVGAGRQLPSPPSSDAARLPGPQDVAILLFTSGTTGQPKAVPLTHANLLSNVSAILAEGIVGPRDRALVPLPLHHAYSLTVGILCVLAAGATIVLPAGISGPQLLEGIRQGRVTALLGVPRLYAALVANIRSGVARQSGLAGRLFATLVAASSLIHRWLGLPVGRWMFRSLRNRLGPSLRLLVSGGAALSLDIETTLDGLGWQVLTGYGLTETSPILTFNRPGRTRIGSVGQALPGVSLRIAGPDPDGIGEIEARGSSVFQGYSRDSDGTSTAFTPDGWFRTGDLGRLDAGGHLFITARAKETIVLPSGKKIYPESVETSYAAENPIIREIAVLRGAEGLVALVVPNDEAVLEAGALRLQGLVHDALRMRGRILAPHLRLTGFAVTRQALPRTQLGKIRRHLLPALFENARRPDRPAADETAVNSAAELLANPRAVAVWDWMRARYPTRPVNLDTSPQLDLGIDSLGWVELSLALQRECGIVLTEQQIARVVTIRDLLREALAATPPGAGPIDIAEREKVWLEPYGLWVRILRVLGEAVVRIVMRCFFRLRVEGLGKLPEPPFMLCPNHASYLDGFALAAALPHRQLRATYWAGWTGVLFSSRIRRLFSRAAQAIPIDPDRAAMAGVALGAAVLARGRTLVWFPEGALSPDESLQAFQPGVGAVLERRSTPVVPVYIAGTATALPPGQMFPRPRRIIVRFGDPFDPVRAMPGCAGRPHEQLIADAVHAAVAALVPKTG